MIPVFGFVRASCLGRGLGDEPRHVGDGDGVTVRPLHQRRGHSEAPHVREKATAREALPPRAPDRSFAELCDYWLAHRAPRKRSQKDDESIIRAHLRPAFGRLQLRALGIEQVDALVAARHQ